jgi:hypothetical protein
MIEKEYYRLPELKERFGFTEYDYLYLCEQYNNPIRFFVLGKYFVMTAPNFSEIKVLGVVAYTGIINLKPHDRKRLLQEGSISITECELLNQSGIRLYESPSQEFIESCFDERYAIEPLALENIPNKSITARVIEEKHREMLYVEFDSLRTKLKFDLDQMVLTKDDIEWAQHCLSTEIKAAETSETNKRENAFHTYLAELMKAHPRKGATKLWNYIIEQYKAENDLIDPDYLLREVSRDEIIWGKGSEKDRSMKKSTFENLFSRLNKKNNCNHS